MGLKTDSRSGQTPGNAPFSNISDRLPRNVSAYAFCNRGGEKNQYAQEKKQKQQKQEQHHQQEVKCPDAWIVTRNQTRSAANLWIFTLKKIAVGNS